MKSLSSPFMGSALSKSKYFGRLFSAADISAPEILFPNNTNHTHSWKKWEYGTFQYGNSTNASSTSSSMEHIEASNVYDHYWTSLDSADVKSAVNILSQYCLDNRLSRFHEVLGNRSENVRMVFENPSNANNVWAALRTFDAFGIQYIDVITDTQTYHQSWRKDTMITALGAQKWLSIDQHKNTTDCLANLKQMGYKILATDVHYDAKSIYDIDWKSQKTVIVMGNEESGVSDEVKQLADERFFIPMKGFAESLNLAAACAVICSHLESSGALRGNLSDDQKQRVLLMWLSRTVTNSPGLLRRGGLPVVGNRIHSTVMGFTTKP